MNLNVNIKTNQYCHILIEDNSEYQNEYNNSINPSSLKFADTVSIVSITHSDTREDKLEYYTINNSKTFKVPINFDGVFTVKYIVIPTKEWYDRVLKSVTKLELILAFGGRIYIYDDTNIIYITSITEEIVSVSEFIASEYKDNLSVSYVELKLLAICKLRKCYINLCLLIFNNKNFSPCWNKNKVDSELVYKRDLVWMAINVITYLWEQGLNELEIARILSQINSCNGLCNPYPSNFDNKSSGCGCSN